MQFLLSVHKELKKITRKKITRQLRRKFFNREVMTFCRKVNRPTENETVRRKSTKRERKKESEVKIIKLYLSIKVLPSLALSSLVL